jgi:hypothetical protein
VRHLAALLCLVATPAVAQTTNTDCTARGNTINCTSTTQQPFNALGAVQQGYDFADRLRPPPRPAQPSPGAGPSPAAQAIIVRDMNDHHECNRSVEFAAQTGNAALMQLALSCKPE